MTHLAMPEQWTIDAVDLATYAYLVFQTEGIEALPELRGENNAVPGRTGRVWAGKVHDQRSLALAIFVRPDSADGTLVEPTDAEGVEANLQALYRILAAAKEHTLGRVEPDGTTRTAQAECVAIDNIDDSIRGSLIGFTAHFLLADPWFYGADVVQVVPIAASPTNFTLTHPGSVRGRRMTLDFLGPIVSPRLTQLSSGIWVECLVTVDAAEHLIIDCEDFTAENDGANVIGSVRHSGDHQLMVFEPGSNSLRVTTSSPGGQLTITFKPPYVS